MGLRLTKDPVDWSQAGVVCERKGFGTEGWGIITEATRGSSSTTSDHIYVMNGKARVTSKGTICVSPAKLPESSKICKYYKKENKGLWKAEDVEISVQKECEGNLLQSSTCFGVLKSNACKFLLCWKICYLDNGDFSG
jgi:hypothetical protein